MTVSVVALHITHQMCGRTPCLPCTSITGYSTDNQSLVLRNNLRTTKKLVIVLAISCKVFCAIGSFGAGSIKRLAYAGSCSPLYSPWVQLKVQRNVRACACLHLFLFFFFSCALAVLHLTCTIVFIKARMKCSEH